MTVITLTTILTATAATVSPNRSFDTRPLKSLSTGLTIGRIAVGAQCDDFSYSIRNFRYHYAANADGLEGVAICATPPVEIIINPWLRAAPGQIEFEDYTFAQDRDERNRGGAYRNDFGVDVETRASGNETVTNVGWTGPGEYLEYEIDVITTGFFDASFRYARIDTGVIVVMGVLIDGIEVAEYSDIISVTGAWDKWEVTPIGGLLLGRGTHTIRVEIRSGYINLDWFKLNREGFVTLSAGGIA